MALANCTHCGALYNQVSQDTCPKCMKEEEQQYSQVRDFLKKNRHALTSEVSEATNVPVGTIIKFIRQGRLTISNSPNLTCPCEKCGTPILSGQYCDNCKKTLLKSLQTGDQHSPTQEAAQQSRTGYFSKTK